MRHVRILDQTASLLDVPAANKLGVFSAQSWENVLQDLDSWEVFHSSETAGVSTCPTKAKA